MSDASIVNLEQISQIIVISDEFEQINVTERNLFSVTVGYRIFYGLGKFNCWATFFHPHLPNINFHDGSSKR